MLFSYEVLHDTVLGGDSDEELDLILIEQSGWEQDGKYQSQDTIFQHDGKYYTISQTRSGSYFSEYHYEDMDIDSDGNIDCEEVFKTEVIISEWNRNNIKTDVDEMREELSEARGLLYEARDLMSNVHCYDTDIYREIGKFLNGEEEE
jgi:hypothetical protein